MRGSEPEWALVTCQMELPVDTHKARDFIEKGAPVGEQQGKELRRTALQWLVISGFMVMGLISGCLWPIVLLGP